MVGDRGDTRTPTLQQYACKIINLLIIIGDTRIKKKTNYRYCIYIKKTVLTKLFLYNYFYYLFYRCITQNSLKLYNFKMNIHSLKYSVTLQTSFLN